PLGAVSTMAGPEERGGRGAGGSGEAQAQGQPRDSAMAPVQPSLGQPRDEPGVFGLDKFNGNNFAEWSFRMEYVFDHYDLQEVMEGTEKRPENDPEKSPEKNLSCLDEVVMDVVGPLKLGAAGAEYFLTIVDVYTRMTWVYVLSKKSDLTETVKTDWLPMVERQQDRL
ncbi:unnamed protein product, partial [Closterium sp. NIES-54]